jgi:uncharacterized protein with HEPN domain
MKKDDVMRLQHMLEAAREATFFAKGHKREDLDTNRMLMHTLVRVIEIIGEAATNVSAEARERIPNIEWHKVIGMRNRLAHAYFDINLDILWDTVDYDIPRLISQLEFLPYLQKENGTQ